MMNKSVVTALSLMKVATRKKCWKERENWHQLTAEPRPDNLYPNVGFQQPKPTNQARTTRPFSPYRLVPNDGMVQLTFAGVPLTAAT